MSYMKENIWTQLARVLNELSDHKVSKKDAYWKISALIEMCTPEEIEEMISHREHLNKPHSLGDLLKNRSDEKVNTFKLGLKEMDD